MHVCLSGAMDSASDFGSGGWGFESPLGLFWKKSCANRESNPALKLGKLQCYRYTIGASVEFFQPNEKKLQGRESNPGFLRDRQEY